jgi:hypothetical protein
MRGSPDHPRKEDQMKFLASAALLLTAGALSLTVAALLVFATVIFALVLFFPLSLLGLVGVLAGLENRTVHQHDPALDPRRWRDGP